MKNIFLKLRWILSKAKPVFIYLILIVLLGSIMSLLSVGKAIVSKYLIDMAIVGNMKMTLQWIIILGAVIFGSIGIRALNNIINTFCNSKISNKIQEKLYKHITYSEWMEISKYHSVNLLTRMTSDVNNVTSTIVNTVPNIISMTVMFLASFFALLKLDKMMAIAAIITFPIFILVSKYIGGKMKLNHIDIQNQDVKYNSFIQESLQNSMIIKTFCLEENNIKDLLNIQERKFSLQMKSSKLSTLSSVFLSLGGSIGYFLVFCWGAMNLSKGVGTFGTLTAMLQLFGSIQAPLYELASSFPQLVRSIGSAERLMEIEEIKKEKNIENLEDIINPTIKFKDISFSYSKDYPVLENISFDIKPGEIIGLVGSSGQGKTTIIRLLLSLIHPDKGNLFIEECNEDININRNHRKYISYIPQGSNLFSGSIQENILYGDINACKEEVKEACIRACAWEFIEKLENKLDTIIGEKGIGLSEGQAQRISIARALIRKKPILILDEATSALDLKTEIELLKSIKKLEYKPTCIIITHRTTSLEICDRVLNLEKGKISEIDKNCHKKINTTSVSTT